MLNAAVAAFYYLRVVVYMFMREPAERPAEPPATAASSGRGSLVATVLTIALGLFPNVMLGIVEDAAQAVTQIAG